MRIGIINQEPGATDMLRSVVALKPRHQVIWSARSGAEAMELCTREAPDLVLMDLLMTGMDGVETTRRIMARTPCAIVIVTGSVQANSARVFEAMGRGALDAVDLPLAGSTSLRDRAAPLLKKLDTISRLIGETHVPSAAQRRDATPPSARRDLLVAIGASAGGPRAVSTVLRDLPIGFPAAIVVVQHVDEQFAVGMSEWLQQHSALPVRIARDGDRPTVGTVLLAGSSDHLTLASPDRLGYTPDPVNYAYRPSIDVFFQSVQRFWRGDAIGVLLTGMGKDGALGLLALRRQGHHTIAQDEATSAVYGMPKAAAALDAAVDVLAVERIGSRLIDLTIGKKQSRAV